MTKALNTNHMKTASLIALAAIAASVSGSAFAGQDLVLKRVDHPNGPPTFLYVPDSSRNLPTVALYNNGRTFDSSRDDAARPQKVRRGRGDNITVGQR